MNHGDHHYFVLETVDLDVSSRFFAGLLAWEITDGEVTNTAFRGAISDRHDRSIWVHVDDCEKACERVTTLGGTPGEVRDEASGPSVECRDDQDNLFFMNTLIPAYRDLPNPDPLPAGELGYFTIPVGDTDQAVDFYSQLFGWTFDPPGSSGVQAEYRHCNSGTLPFGFTAAGDRNPSLYFSVPDVEEAGIRVRELGGSHGAIVGSEHGPTLSGCADPVGVRFELWKPPT